MRRPENLRGQGRDPVARIRDSFTNAVKRMRYQNGPEVKIPRIQWFALCRFACFYCGHEPACGVDRVDSSVKLYDWDNVRPCCLVCNRAKASMTTAVFAAWINQAWQHMAKGFWDESCDYRGLVQQRLEADAGGQDQDGKV